MRYVASASQCLTKFENAVTIKPGPVQTCVLGALVFRTTSTCTVRASRLLTLPAASGNVYFCALKIIGIGTLRAVASPTQCSKLEFPVVVTPSNRQPDAVADTIVVGDEVVVPLNVLGNDTDPDNDTLQVTALGGSPVGVPTITGGGTGISYDSTNAYAETNGFGQSFTDTFTYTISDGHGGSDTATVTVVTWDETFDYAAACIPLVLSSQGVLAGGTVTASGTAVTGGGLITILLDGNPIGQTTSSTTPNFPPPLPPPFPDPGTSYNWSTPVTIPANTTLGNHTLQAAQIRSTTQPQGCPNQVATIGVGAADISLSYLAPHELFPASIGVFNAGPAAARVSVFLSGASTVGVPPDQWQQTTGATGITLQSVNPIPSGGALGFYVTGTGGYAEVSYSSNPDPDSTPNNHVTTEDDYVSVPAS